MVGFFARRLGDERDDEADQSECLDEGRSQDEDGEETTLDLRLASHRGRRAIRSETNAKTGADNTEAVTDNSHDSSFAIRRTTQRRLPKYLCTAGGAREMPR